MEQMPGEFNITPNEEELAEEEYERRLSLEQRQELGAELSQLGDELVSRIDEIRLELKNASGEVAAALQEELELAEEEYDSLRIYADGIVQERIH